MSEEGRTFHESWYRIANQHICLRTSVKVRRQMFRGSKWYVISDPFSNQFFRITPSAYEFVARLSMKRSVEEVWEEVLSRNPDNAPGQEDVIHLLAQLYHANLLHYELPADSAKLFERYKKQKQRIIKATLMNIMFFRIPLFDPDALLKRLLPIVRLFMSPVGAIIWLAVVISGLKIAIDNFAQLGVQSQGILAPSNLFLLYLGLVLIKGLHEFGHAFAVRRLGGEVHTMGLMFLIFNPVPYMDATAAWSFRNKWHKVLVGASGMIVELFVAAVAVFIWANTGPGIIHSLAYNMLFIASVSTLLFNINPLMRFDGYYILSDLLDIPNLQTQATQQLIHLVERYAFGYKKSESPASSKKEAFWLTFFGIMSGIYRIFVFSSVLLFVADRFLLAGIIMAAICAVCWVIIPLVKLIRYLSTNQRLYRIRLRAVSVSMGTLTGCFVFLYFCPFPNSFKAPGVLKAYDFVYVVNKVEGNVDELIVPSNMRVKAGDLLVRLRNKELEFEIREAEARLKEAKALRQKAMQDSQSDLKPIDSRIASLNKRLEQMHQEEEDLAIKAEINGVWIAPNAEEYIGMWIRRGSPLGQLVNDKTFYFAAVVSQQDVSRIFSDEVKSSEVRLKGESEIRIPARKYTKIPMEHTKLPSAALGWGAGGEVAINTQDASGVSAAEPFYEVRAQITQDTKAALLHGRSGKIKFKLAMEPLFKQWWRKLRQLIQKRYQL